MNKALTCLLPFLLVFITLTLAQTNTDSNKPAVNIVINKEQCGHILPYTSFNYNITIDTDASEVLFLANWSKAGDFLKLNLLSPAGPINPYNRSVQHSRGSNYEFYTIPKPKSGDWSYGVESYRIPSLGVDYCMRVTGLQFPEISNNGLQYSAPQSNITEIENNSIAKLTENYTECSIGADHNFEFLIIGVEVDIFAPGEYSLIGSIYDSNSSEIAWSVSHDNLSIGRYIINLTFDGQSIREHRTNGPFYLRDLTLFLGSSDTGLVICDNQDKTYVTSNLYNYSNFL